MNRASSATGWVRNPVMKSPELDPTQASSYELGWTFNPITGCLNGCPYCYAYKLAHGRLKSRYLENQNFAPLDFDEDIPDPMFDPFYPRFWAKRLRPIEGLHGISMKPRGIFVCDMGELFGDWVPYDWQERIFNTIRINPWHRFYLLTKQPQNLPQWSPFPDNCWVGVTATDNRMFNYGLAYLSEVKAKVKYASLEPLLGRIEPVGIGSSILDWLIIGGQSGKQRFYPPEEWIEEIVEAADKVKLPIFMKDNLKPILPDREPSYRKLGEGAGYIALSPLRQELPNV